MSNNSEILKQTLSNSYLHEQWVNTYIDDSKILYDLVFDELKKFLWSSGRNDVLDAGCGNGINTLRLLQRGFNVTACDFSNAALDLSRTFLRKNYDLDNYKLLKEDILSLSFNDAEFDVVLCWGVLMHIYEIEKALDELCRVTKTDGYVIICEVSMKALDSILIQALKYMFRQYDRSIKSRFGKEYWSETQAGKILVRKTDIDMLINFMSEKGFTLVNKIPGQFSQIYTKMKKDFLRKLILKFNLFWFKHLKFIGPSVEQVLVFKKK